MAPPKKNGINTTTRILAAIVTVLLGTIFVMAQSADKSLDKKIDSTKTELREAIQEERDTNKRQDEQLLRQSKTLTRIETKLDLFMEWQGVPRAIIDSNGSNGNDST